MLQQCSTTASYVIVSGYQLTELHGTQPPSWEANGSSAGQEIPRILRIPNVHHRIHKRPTSVPTWATSIQFMPPHYTSWRSILGLSSHLRLVLPNGSFPQIPHQNPVCSSSVSHKSGYQHFGKRYTSILAYKIEAVRLYEQYRGADNSLARPERKQDTATEVFEFQISYL